MKASDPVSQVRMEAFVEKQSHPLSLRSLPNGVLYTLYALCLAATICTWFIAIRAPLWLDETVSFSLIRGGFKGIMSRQMWPDSQAYSCLLWLWTQALGTREIVLRISSVLPMLGAAYLLFCAARELFDREVALIATIVFCLHPIVVFAAIDVRPYAFAVLAINCSILIFVRLERDNSNWLAALFGFSAACIVQFQLLFLVILPAFVLCFIGLKQGDRKTLWRQLGIALMVFAVMSLPVIPRFEYMFHTSGTHVFDVAPRLLELASTLALKRLGAILVGAILIAAATRRLDLVSGVSWRFWLCASLALVPILILFGISRETSIHVFVPRYRLVAVPGIALCWGFAASRIRSRTLRLLFCVALVGAGVYRDPGSPLTYQHGYTWKYALEAAQSDASVDNAPLLICSDLPEADYMPMPVGPAIEESGILAPISYYRVKVPVVALPRTLNAEAIRVSSRFVQEAAQRHQRFLVLGYLRSADILAWIAKDAAGSYKVRELPVSNEIKVLEFTPRSGASTAP